MMVLIDAKEQFVALGLALVLRNSAPRRGVRGKCQAGALTHGLLENELGRKWVVRTERVATVTAGDGVSMMFGVSPTLGVVPRLVAADRNSGQSVVWLDPERVLVRWNLEKTGVEDIMGITDRSHGGMPKRVAVNKKWAVLLRDTELNVWRIDERCNMLKLPGSRGTLPFKFPDAVQFTHFQHHAVGFYDEVSVISSVSESGDLNHIIVDLENPFDADGMVRCVGEPVNIDVWMLQEVVPHVMRDKQGSFAYLTGLGGFHVLLKPASKLVKLPTDNSLIGVDESHFCMYPEILGPILTIDIIDVNAPSTPCFSLQLAPTPNPGLLAQNGLIFSWEPQPPGSRDTTRLLQVTDVSGTLLMEIAAPLSDGSHVWSVHVLFC
ncbi:hypothetical protein Pelo_2537 [Pelomyxa schiedti]|nr:hypothetical protein Pelo_2537 [Pelomyxa schiedti]